MLKSLLIAVVISIQSLLVVLGGSIQGWIIVFPSVVFKVHSLLLSASKILLIIIVDSI